MSPQANNPIGMAALASPKAHGRERGPAWPKRRTREGGFSLIETLLVVAILGIVAAIALPVFGTVIGQAKADSAAATAIGALQDARARATAERRNVQLDFVAPNIIRALRVEPAGGLTLVGETILEGGQEFQLATGVPVLTEFGADSAVDFTGTLPVMFTTDGSLIDSAGDPVNGTIHLAHDVNADSSRAITILGVTGLMQTWKYSGGAWRD